MIHQTKGTSHSQQPVVKFRTTKKPKKSLIKINDGIKNKKISPIVERLSYLASIRIKQLENQQRIIEKKKNIAPKRKKIPGRETYMDILQKQNQRKLNKIESLKKLESANITYVLTRKQKFLS